MTGRVVHRGSPEVIQEHLMEGGSTDDVMVVLDCGEVVMDEVALQGVEITDERTRGHKRVHMGSNVSRHE